MSVMENYEYQGVPENISTQDDSKAGRYIPAQKPRQHKPSRKATKSVRKLKADTQKQKKKLRDLSRDVARLSQQVEYLRDRDPNGFYTLRKKVQGG